jgi:GR25 family glycosyltransferase involved in LPS biosynthesis|tara:strand:+ start:2389 stop:3015 length:627 start_codon:yes stop_codon:yes gene_type:complete
MIDKIFICHWDKLTDRKEELIKVLSEENIFDYEFVCDYDKDTWSEEEIKYDFPKIFEVVEGYGRKLKSSEISLSLKHVKIIREVAEKYEYALVLEDDVILCDNFVEEFLESHNQLPDDWDIAWVGTCCGLHAPTSEGKRVYRVNGSRCTHAYAISNIGAKKVLSELKYCNTGADFFFNLLIEKFNLNNYWFEPALAIQSPEFKTTIQN